jgi:hypothetical protein
MPLIKLFLPGLEKVIDILLIFAYNIFNFWETTIMTDQQFEMLMIYSGMLQDGCSNEGAIAYIMLMDDFPATDIAWLIKKVGASKKSELYKDAERKRLTESRASGLLDNVLMGT